MRGNDDGSCLGAGKMLGGGLAGLKRWMWGGDGEVGGCRRGFGVREVVTEGRGGGCRFLYFRVGMAASFVFISLPAASWCEIDRD